MAEHDKIPLYPEDVRRMNEIKSFIDEHFCDDVHLENLAVKFTISVSTLRRHFKLCHSEQISSYIHKVRMLKAMKLLKEHTMPVSQVGMMVGYRHRSPFTHAFTKFFGVSPVHFGKNDI